MIVPPSVRSQQVFAGAAYFFHFVYRLTIYKLVVFMAMTGEGYDFPRPGIFENTLFWFEP